MRYGNRRRTGTDDRITPGRGRRSHALRAAVPLLALAALIGAGPSRGAERATLPAAVASSTRSAPVEVMIRWDLPKGRVSPFAYSLNLYKGPDPAFTQNPRYLANLGYMAPGIVRIHQGGMAGSSAESGGWVDVKNRRWNAAKIRAALAGLDRLRPAPELLLNIPTWPEWMPSRKGILDPDHTDAFARFCADLVRLVNRETPRRFVRYWEPLNEKELAYADAGRMKDLIALWRACARAMKAADPRIRVGGLAFERPDRTDLVDPFITATAGEADFISLHSYVSGSRDDTTQSLLDRAASLAGYQRHAVETVKRVTGRTVPVFMDEFNLSWNPPEDRMGTMEGALFDALVYVQSVEAGSSGVMAWNEMDGWYGKTDNEYRRRPGAHLLHLLNAHFVGRRVRLDGGDDRVKAFAVERAVERGGGMLRALLLINGGPEARTARIRWMTDPTQGMERPPAAKFQLLRMNGAAPPTSQTFPEASWRDGLLLTPSSLTFVLSTTSPLNRTLRAGTVHPAPR